MPCPAGPTRVAELVVADSVTHVCDVFRGHALAVVVVPVGVAGLRLGPETVAWTAAAAANTEKATACKACETDATRDNRRHTNQACACLYCAKASDFMTLVGSSSSSLWSAGCHKGKKQMQHKQRSRGVRIKATKEADPLDAGRPRPSLPACLPMPSTSSSMSRCGSPAAETTVL